MNAELVSGAADGGSGPGDMSTMSWVAAEDMSLMSSGALEDMPAML